MKTLFKRWRHLATDGRARWRRARDFWAGVRFRWERVPADCWVGVYVRRRPQVVESELIRRGFVPAGGIFALAMPVSETTYVERDRVDVWICLVPCLPLHVWHVGRVRQRAPGWKPAQASVAAGEPPAVRLARTAVLVN